MSSARADRRTPRRRRRRVTRWLTSPFRLGGRAVASPFRALGRGLAGLAPRTWLIVTLVVTAILFSIAWPTVQLTHEADATLYPVIALVGVAPLLLIRSRPFVGWLVWCAGAAVIPGLFPTLPGYSFPWQVTAFLVLLALAFAIGVRERPREVVAAWLVTTVLFSFYLPAEISPGWIFGLTAIIGVGLLVRWLVVSRRELAEQTEVSEVERARRAVAEERTRIARDLHDVVAHRMSMVVVQAQSAQYRLGGVDPAVSAEFTSIAEQAREALNEVRGMLGVLRSDGQLAEEVPQPGTEDSLRLLQQAREAGLELTWRGTGDPALCGEASAMVLYRILQESLANASRHAPGAPVHVEIDFAELVRVSVRNGAPTGAASPGRHSGQGIAGMQARAAAVGGTLTTAAVPDGGFEVRAELPAHASTAPAS